ncbi:MAG: hypothetical protein IJX71_06090, partial [Oscillospiraceae bacterium]|nr:hypothetical protein [Oscillospiraceae bacterium]
MALREPIPLLKLFEQCKLTGPLAQMAEQCIVHNITIHPNERTAEADVAFQDVTPDTPTLRSMGIIISGCYGMEGLILRPIADSAPTADELGEEPPLPEEPPVPEEYPVSADPYADGELPPMPDEEPPLPEEPPMTEEDVFRQTAALREEMLRQVAANAPAYSPSKKRKQAEPPTPTGDMILGKAIHRKPIPMKDVSLDMGIVTVCGRVFFVEHRELTKRKAWIINFYITDNTNSLVVSRFLENRQANPVIEKIK